MKVRNALVGVLAAIALAAVSTQAGAALITRTIFSSTLSFFGPDDPASPLPAPQSLVLLAAGLLGVAARRRSRA